ncbi:MAG: PAS domain S-box protein [Acidobacteria bacterium]|nr:PAS domain S-box protein [Acidobacteriota bacterium]
MKRKRTPAKRKHPFTNGGADAVREAEAQLRSLTEQWLVGIVIIQAGQFKYVNRAVIKMMGYSRAELLAAASVLEFVAEEDRARVRENLRLREEGENPTINYSFRVRRKDGALLDLDVVGSRVSFQGRPAVMSTVLDVTERKRAEITLRESEHRYRLLFENMLDGYAYCRMLFDHGEPQDFVYMDVNEAFERLTGLMNVVGKKVSEVIPGIRDSNPELFEIYGRVALTGKPERFETYLRSLGIWFSIAVYSPAKEYFVAVFDNITERRRAEEQVRLLLALTQAINEASDFGSALRMALEKVCSFTHWEMGEVWMPSSDGSALELGSVCHGRSADLELFGAESKSYVFPPGKGLPGRTWVSRKPEWVKDISVGGEMFPRAPLALKAGIKSALAVPSVAGDRLLVLVFLMRETREQDAQLVEVVSAVATQLGFLFQRKQTEGALKLFRTLIDRSNDVIEVVDPETGRFVDVNERGCLDLGYSREEFLALSVFDIDPMIDKVSFAKNTNDLRKSGILRWEGIHRRKNGSTFPVEVGISHIQLDREYAVAVVRDITERTQLQAQFLQAQKMEVVGQLASGIAHDFNNLLTVINGRAELASTGLREDDPLRKDFHEIRSAGERAAALTRQLLAFSRRQVMQLEVLNLSTLVARMQNMLQRLIGEDIDLVVGPAQDGGSVVADPVQIEQVVMNLAVNARDAMPNGGALTIETRNVELDEAYAAWDTPVQPGPHVMLAISDTGDGMDEATRTRIFEPFFTTKGPGRGTGLGLSTVYGIVKQSGGTIRVYSELGKGTTFRIYLPRVEEVAHKLQPSPTLTAVEGTETILVVEDDEGVCHLAKRILQSLGYTVLTASHGAEALLLLERHDGPVHLVLTDMVMPGMSGRDLASQLEAISPQMKVLYTSGYTDDAVLHHGLLDKTAHFIGKPYTTAELARKVREVLNSQG